MAVTTQPIVPLIDIADIDVSQLQWGKESHSEWRFMDQGGTMISGSKTTWPLLYGTSTHGAGIEPLAFGVVETLKTHGGVRPTKNEYSRFGRMALKLPRGSRLKQQLARIDTAIKHMLMLKMGRVENYVGFVEPFASEISGMVPLRTTPQNKNLREVDDTQCLVLDADNNPYPLALQTAQTIHELGIEVTGLERREDGQFILRWRYVLLVPTN